MMYALQGNTTTDHAGFFTTTKHEPIMQFHDDLKHVITNSIVAHNKVRDATQKIMQPYFFW